MASFSYSEETKGDNKMFKFGQGKKASFPTESKWSVLKGQHDGKPMIIRRNESAKQLRSQSEYIYRVGVAIPLRYPNSEGFPSNEEMIKLNSIEDALIDELEKTKMHWLFLLLRQEE
jgi:hypothetical protein